MTESYLHILVEAKNEYTAYPKDLLLSRCSKTRKKKCIYPPHGSRNQIASRLCCFVLMFMF